jgi:hypothetical protein
MRYYRGFDRRHSVILKLCHQNSVHSITRECWKELIRISLNKLALGLEIAIFPGIQKTRTRIISKSRIPGNRETRKKNYFHCFLILVQKIIFIIVTLSIMLYVKLARSASIDVCRIDLNLLTKILTQPLPKVICWVVTYMSCHSIVFKVLGCQVIGVGSRLIKCKNYLNLNVSFSG